MADRRGSGAGRVAVVTGAGGRIGTCVVDELAGLGFEVVALDLPTACPEGDARYAACDLTDAERTAEVFAGIVGTHGRIDLLVHSAALSAIGPFEAHDVEVHRRVIEVTHLGAVAATQAAMPGLRRAGGRVVLIGSVAGFAPVLGRPAYVAAKHAVTGLFTAIRPELSAQGVSMTIVHPTFVAGGVSEAGRATGAARMTAGEELTPGEVAAAVVDGALRGRDLVLVGRTARLAWTLNRLAPGLYTKLMIRRLHAEEGGAA